MERYLPGAVLAICGIAVYAIGCVLFLALPIDIDITRFFAFAGRLPPNLPPPRIALASRRPGRPRVYAHAMRCAEELRGVLSSGAFAFWTI